jgi:hypothetical protein
VQELDGQFSGQARAALSRRWEPVPDKQLLLRIVESRRRAAFVVPIPVPRNIKRAEQKAALLDARRSTRERLARWLTGSAAWLGELCERQRPAVR